jgi:hypothetical protein
MITQTSEEERRATGGTALLLVISIATIATVAAEAAFIYRASWTLLPVIVLAIIVVAAGVVGAVGRLIDGETSGRPATHGH